MDASDIEILLRYHPRLYSTPPQVNRWSHHWREEADVEGIVCPPDWACLVLNNIWVVMMVLLGITIAWRIVAERRNPRGASLRLSERALAASPPFVAVLYGVKLALLTTWGYDFGDLLIVEFLPLTCFVVFFLSLEGLLLWLPSVLGTKAGGIWQRVLFWVCVGLALLCLLGLVIYFAGRELLIAIGIIVVLCLFFL